jgi:coenzyme F420 hydrogenase subunit beta
MSIHQVVAGGFCIGCGACAAVVPSIRIEFNRHGDLVARIPSSLPPEQSAAAAAICPFAATDDETTIAKEVFGAPPMMQEHGEVGLFRDACAAYAPAFRTRGSSGGLATWVLDALLRRGLVDAVIHVAPSFDREDGRVFSYRLATTAEVVAAGATSFYFPVSMDEVLRTVRERPGRYAITGVPCFHKALRLLRAADPLIDERIRYQVGIVCGQMKSAHYMRFLAAAAGAPPGAQIVDACFRRKVPGRRASDYAFEVITATAGLSSDGAAADARPGTQVHRVLNSRIGVNWGMGYFKPKACDFCDDVFAETADIAAMDAWLPGLVEDGQGWSLAVVRSEAMQRLCDQGAASGELVTQPVSLRAVADSQRGGLNHRRRTLAYRLWLHRKRWHPQKRQPPTARLPVLLRLEQRLRAYLRQRSRELWLRTGCVGKPEAFFRGMVWPERAYRLLGRVQRALGMRRAKVPAGARIDGRP